MSRVESGGVESGRVESSLDESGRVELSEGHIVQPSSFLPITHFALCHVKNCKTE